MKISRIIDSLFKFTAALKFSSKMWLAVQHSFQIASVSDYDICSKLTGSGKYWTVSIWGHSFAFEFPLKYQPMTNRAYLLTWQMHTCICTCHNLKAEGLSRSVAAFRKKKIPRMYYSVHDPPPPYFHKTLYNTTHFTICWDVSYILLKSIIYSKTYHRSDIQGYLADTYLNGKQLHIVSNSK